MVAKNQRPENNLGAGEFIALGGLGRSLEPADAVLKLAALGFELLDFLAMGCRFPWGGTIEI